MNKLGDLASLTHSMKSRLRECVGESYWKKVEDLLPHLFRQKQLRNPEELESSRPLPPQPQHIPPPQNHPKDDEKHGDESFTTKNGDVKTGDWFNGESKNLTLLTPKRAVNTQDVCESAGDPPTQQRHGLNRKSCSQPLRSYKRRMKRRMKKLHQ